MFESLASCFAFRCSAPLNITLLLGPVISRFESHFLRSDHEMNYTIRRGDEEAIEIFAQLLDFVAARDAVNFQK